MLLIRLAWRSLWRNKRRTLITVSSIGFGLAFAVFFVALGEGMYGQMVDQVVRMQAGHVTLEHRGYEAAPAVDLYIAVSPDLRRKVASVPGVERTKLHVLGQGIAKSATGTVTAALMGVEPELERLTSPLPEHMVQGSFLEQGDGALVVVGSELAGRLDVEVGKKVVLTTNDAQGDLVEELCRVKGIFRTGSDELDGYFIQMPLDFARRLFRMPEETATRLGVVLGKADAQQRVLTDVRGLDLPPSAVVRPWQEVLPELAAYIRMDRASNWIFQGILVFLILFTILNTLLMSVMERQREFAVLLALGTLPGQIRLQLLIESAFLGLAGCALGACLGSLAAVWVDRAGIDLSVFLEEGITISGFAVSTTLNTRLTPQILATTTAVVFAATVCLSLIPMRRATRVAVAETLR